MSFAPAPHALGLTASPDLSWDDIGVAQPSPADLFGCDPDLTWEEFGSAAPGTQAGE